MLVVCPAVTESRLKYAFGDVDDAIADAKERLGESLREFEKSYRRLQSLRAEHLSLSTAESAREQEVDLLRHQIAEITGANPTTSTMALAARPTCDRRAGLAGSRRQSWRRC